MGDGRWAMGEGYAVIPSSTKRDNLASNLKALDCNDRLVSPEGLAPQWD